MRPTSRSLRYRGILARKKAFCSMGLTDEAGIDGTDLVDRLSGQTLCSCSTAPENNLGLTWYAIAHSIGRWLLYPGSVCLLNKVPPNILVNARTCLIEDFHGKRAKLIARDGNEIDTMFVDRRKRKSPEKRGMQLVICCEGNGSFYEVGCFFTPLKAGYSVLGWNHPGFGRSTGKPYPANDVNAMDVVIQYAIRRLGFALPDIAIYGYSLGSYTATWAAKTYPELGGLVLDASFDSLLPLAMKVMAKSWKKLVVKTGPVLLIRRTKDEVITTCPFGLEDQITNLRLTQHYKINSLRKQFKSN
uniref:Abhydrolase domain containing 16B n=1 Tax=Podarcis muralis TaxID=64176 RepID=A0A670I4S2_PODMU